MYIQSVFLFLAYFILSEIVNCLQDYLGNRFLLSGPFLWKGDSLNPQTPEMFCLSGSKYVGLSEGLFHKSRIKSSRCVRGT